MSGRRDIRLLPADVDGTLLTHDKVLAGACATPCSDCAARASASLSGMAILIEPLALDTPIAGFNGGLLVHPDLTIIEERRLSPDVAKAAIELILKHELDAWVYAGNDWLVCDRKAPHVDREASGFSVAMGNAGDEVKRQASAITELLRRRRLRQSG